MKAMWMVHLMAKLAMRMRCVTWPGGMGHPKPHIWNQRPQFASSLCNFYGATTTIKGEFTWEHTHCPSSSAFVVPATRRSTLSGRSFCAAGTRAWNSLPPTVTAASTIAVIIPSTTEIPSVHKVVSIMTMTFASWLDTLWLCKVSV